MFLVEGLACRICFLENRWDRPEEGLKC